MRILVRAAGERRMASPTPRRIRLGTIEVYRLPML